MTEKEMTMWECEDHIVEYTDKNNKIHKGEVRCFCSSYEIDGEALLIFENEDEEHPIFESDIQEIRIVD